MRTAVIVCCLLVAPLLGGCGTAVNLANERSPYGGVATDLGCSWGGLLSLTPFVEPDPHYPAGFGFFLGLAAFADTPFSLVGDTVTLPIILKAALEAAAAGADKRE